MTFTDLKNTKSETGWKPTAYLRYRIIGMTVSNPVTVLQQLWRCAVLGIMKKKLWLVVFEENGSEHGGSMLVTATKLQRDPTNERAFTADGVLVEMDENIIRTELLPKN